MNRQACEELIPIGLQLYQSTLDPEVCPDIYILDGSETQEDVQAYFDMAGLTYAQEEMVLGIALRGTKKTIVLISADSVQTPFQFFQVLWHELGHCTYRRLNPKADWKEQDQIDAFCGQKMIWGVVEKFWDEAIAQSASNKVIRSLSEDLLKDLCPDYVEQSEKERKLLGFFLQKGIQTQKGGSQMDDPLLNLMGIPFDPYALAIYSSESATNALLTAQDPCVGICEGNNDFKEALGELIQLVAKQFAQDDFFFVGTERFDETYDPLTKVAAALGAEDKTLVLMNASLKDLAKFFK